MDSENKEPRPADQSGAEHKKRRRRNGRGNRPQNAQTSGDGVTFRSGERENRRPFGEGNRKPHQAGQKGGYGARWGVVDPYGKPTEEDALSLEELRARIVL